MDVPQASTPPPLPDGSFKLLLERNPLPISISRNGVLIHVNPAYRKLFGYTPTERVEGRAVFEHIAPDSRLDLQARLKRRGGGEWPAEDYVSRGRRMDGSEFDMRVLVTPIPLEGGLVSFAILMDVTETTQLQEELRSHEERFKALFVNAGIGMALLAMDGTPILVNPALERYLGYTEEEFLRMTFDHFTHPEDVGKDRSLFNELLTGERESYHIEKRYIHKDGRVLWGSLNVGVVRGPTGKPLYAVGMAEDITERKMAKQEKGI